MSQTSDESMKPVLQKDRTTSPTKFTLSLSSDFIAMFSFATGAGAVALGLNVVQALVAVGLGLSVAWILMYFNGLPGYRYGIPMVVQMRPCFGEKFAILAASLRAIPAIAWTGWNSFMGAVGLNLFSILLFGYNNVWVWFFVFHFIQVILAALGVRRMLSFTAYAAVALLVIILVIMVHIFGEFGSERVISAFTLTGGTWGGAFWFAVTGNVSLGVTIAVNASDYVRFMRNKSQANLFWACGLGMVPIALILASLGMVVFTLTGIWSPIDLFVTHVPSYLILGIAMCFIILGQFSTNLFANLIPANLVWCAIFKFPWWFSCVFSGCLSLFIVPWFLTTSSGFYYFMNLYGAMLGPVAGIMIADYVIIRRGKFNLTALYARNSQYTCASGFNLAGVIALTLSSALAIWQIEYSAVIGTAAGGLLYLALYRPLVASVYPQAELRPDYQVESPENIYELKDTYHQ